MIEQDGIPLPWQPESHKPAIPFVICTNGDGHYWMGRYNYEPVQPRWEESCSDNDWILLGHLPWAWIEPEKFVPFVKNKELHRCEHSYLYICQEQLDGTLTLLAYKNSYFHVNFCPWCGFKADEK